MPLAIRSLLVTDKVVDTDAVVTAAVAAEFAVAGVTCVLRYGVSVSAEEFGTILAHGIAVGFLTYGRGSDFTVANGVADAQALLDKAKSLGIPPGMTYGLDLEDPKGASIADVLAYEKAYATQITTVAGNLPGAYLGAGLGLTSKQATGMGAVRYYKSGSRVVDLQGNPTEPERGFCLVQRLPFNQHLGGVQVDYDSAGDDYYGCAWTVVRATPSTTSFSFPIPKEILRDTLPPSAPPPTE